MMRVVEFESRALQDLEWLTSNEQRFAVKALKLVDLLAHTPFENADKPEPLKGNLSGYWSRRINSEHRLLYAVTETTICVIASRGRYD
ncbi:MAG: Txe/YoeB family addiction module toxin [Planctomycetota bacterium]